MMITSTFSFFYLLSIIFIWVEIFAFKNKSKVSKRLNSQDLENSNIRLYLVFFLFKLFYLIWLPLGLFSNIWIMYLFLICLGIINFLVPLSRSKLLVFIFRLFNVISSCIILTIILYRALFQ